MRTLLALAAIAATFPAQPTLAQAQADWLDIGASADGSRFYAQGHELALASVSTSDPSVWVRQVPAVGQGVGWNEGHALYQINCKAQTYQILNVTLFFPDGSKQSHSGEGFVRRVTPQTSLADLVGRVCPAARSSQTLAAAAPGRSKL